MSFVLKMGKMSLYVFFNFVLKKFFLVKKMHWVFFRKKSFDFFPSSILSAKWRLIVLSDIKSQSYHRCSIRLTISNIFPGIYIDRDLIHTELQFPPKCCLNQQFRTFQIQWNCKCLVTISVIVPNNMEKEHEIALFFFLGQCCRLYWSN